MLTEKDYCDYDTCVALKELGYNQYTSLRSYAGKGGVRLWDFDGEPNYKEGELIALSDMYDIPRDGNEVAAPSFYEAQKWLREERHIDVLVYLDDLKGYFPFIRIWEGSWKTFISLEEIEGEKVAYSANYEESLSEGIKEAVKILK